MQEYIHSVCDERSVEPLIARDFGSRSRGLHNEDSDYDILLVYHHPMVEYVKPGEPRQSFGTSKDDIDIMAWDVKKFTQHILESNPTAIELLASDKEYYVEDEYEEWFDMLEHMATTCFKPLALYMHYRSKAKSNYEKYIRKSIHRDGEKHFIDYDTPDEWITESGECFSKNGDFEESTTERTVKRNLFVIQASMKARYIRETTQFPPLKFEGFLEVYGEQFGKSNHRAWAERLAEMKRNGEGDDTVGNICRAFIEKEIYYDIDHEKYVEDEIDTLMVEDFVEELYESKK